MATIETKTKITTCDICGATIDPEDYRLLKEDLEVPIGYFMDLVNTVRVKLTGLNIPYCKSTDNPDVCRNCTAKQLEKVLERVNRRIKSPVKAE